ncbi:MAG: PspC domain-containing protein [Eggerthella lenta]
MADYFNVDPVIVRIIMVVFTLASGGLLGIAYILLWIVLPLEPKEEAPLDVHPQSVHSRRTGRSNSATPRAKPSRGRKMRPIPRKRPVGAMRIPRTPRPLMCRPSPRQAHRAPLPLRLPMLLVRMRLRRAIRMKGGCMPRRNSSRRRSRRARA